MFSERFEKESNLYSSSVSQDIHGTHRDTVRFSLPASFEPAFRLSHTQQNCDWLSLFHDGEQNSRVWCGQPQLELCDMGGREWSNPLQET